MMRILKEAAAVMVVASTLVVLPTTSHARLKDNHLGLTIGNLAGEQASGQGIDADYTDSIYYQLKQLLGERFYNYLLDHDEFVKVQDIAINLIEKKYTVSRGRQQP